MKYYHCVNCGFHGDFKMYRQRNIKCECCDYNDILELDEEEWEEYGKERHEEQREDKSYKDKMNE